jgi:hypothetical protein
MCEIASLGTLDLSKVLPLMTREGHTLYAKLLNLLVDRQEISGAGPVEVTDHRSRIIDRQAPDGDGTSGGHIVKISVSLVTQSVRDLISLTVAQQLSPFGNRPTVVINNAFVSVRRRSAQP